MYIHFNSIRNLKMNRKKNGRHLYQHRDIQKQMNRMIWNHYNASFNKRYFCWWRSKEIQQCGRHHKQKLQTQGKHSSRFVELLNQKFTVWTWKHFRWRMEQTFFNWLKKNKKRTTRFTSLTWHLDSSVHFHFLPFIFLAECMRASLECHTRQEQKLWKLLS